MLLDFVKYGLISATIVACNSDHQQTTSQSNNVVVPAPTPPPPEHKVKYNFWVSPEFTTTQKSLISEAIHKWEKAVNTPANIKKNNWVMLGPDNKLYNVPPESVQTALSKSWKPALSINVSLSGKCTYAYDACFIPHSNINAVCPRLGLTTIGCTILDTKPYAVLIDPTHGNKTLSHVAQHEMGHIFGLDDTYIHGRLMTWVMEYGSQNVSSYDATEYFKQFE